MKKFEGLEQMAEKLRVYDVDQGGWEGDPEGASPKSVGENLTHVGKHLAGVIAFKDFNSRQVVEDEITPDCLQYGMRILRWCDVSFDATYDTEYVMDSVRVGHNLTELNSMPLLQSSIILANGKLLGRQLHDEDHQSMKADALTRRKDSAAEIGGILILASLNTGSYFKVEAAFDNRLDNLRQRFGIPNPDEVI